MKKVIFIIAFLVFSLNIIAQEKINTNDLIGYWIPDQNTSQMFFWKDVNNTLQVQEIDSSRPDAYEVENFQVYDTYIVIKTVFKETSWFAKSTYTLIDKRTLKCVVANADGESTIMYTKIK